MLIMMRVVNRVHNDLATAKSVAFGCQSSFVTDVMHTATRNERKYLLRFTHSVTNVNKVQRTEREK